MKNRLNLNIRFSNISNKQLTKYLTLGLYIIAFVFNIHISNAQSTCPEDESGFTMPITAEVVTDDARYPWGYGNYKVRTLNGRREIKVDWTSVINFGIYGLTNEEFKELFRLTLIVREFGVCPYTGNKQITFFESTTCSKKVRCYFKMAQTSEVECSEGPAIDPPPYLQWVSSHNGTKYIFTENEITCGTACCETTYIVNCQAKSITDSRLVPTVIAKNSVIVGNPCSGSEQGCKNHIINCTSKCN